jgi:hypothetical protein
VAAAESIHWGSIIADVAAVAAVALSGGTYLRERNLSRTHRDDATRQAKLQERVAALEEERRAEERRVQQSAHIVVASTRSASRRMDTFTLTNEGSAQAANVDLSITASSTGHQLKPDPGQLPIKALQPGGGIGVRVPFSEAAPYEVTIR